MSQRATYCTHVTKAGRLVWTNMERLCTQRVALLPFETMHSKGIVTLWVHNLRMVRMVTLPDYALKGLPSSLWITKGNPEQGWYHKYTWNSYCFIVYARLANSQSQMITEAACTRTKQPVYTVSLCPYDWRNLLWLLEVVLWSRMWWNMDSDTFLK